MNDTSRGDHGHQNTERFPMQLATKTVIPPPPPLPPKSRAKPFIPPPPPLPPNAFRSAGSSSLLKKKFAAAMNANDKPEDAEPPFKPCFFFFYGSLMDPEVLQAVLGLREIPVVEEEGWVTGFSMKMWGIYPALIKREGGKISGTVWKVETQSQFLRLVEYETSAYTWCACDVHLSDGEILHDCRTFCWAGDPNSKDLDEGTFNLQRYQRYFKPSVIRRAPL